MKKEKIEKKENQKQKHISVLLKEVIDLMAPKSNENFVDCTVGLGGHSKEILKKTAPNGKVLGIDLNKNTLKIVRENLAEYGERLILAEDSFANLEEIVRQNNLGEINGILLDLGMSSWEIDESGKGFSFQKDEPLDMRFSEKTEITAKYIINRWKEDDLIRIFREYGEERFARPIARKIVEERKKKEIATTGELVDVISQVKHRRGRLNPATQVFQALRIEVNSELENLKNVLEQSVNVLSKGGRVAVISFHSLEDRIVKWFFRENDSLEIVTKKPIMADEEETKSNPRSRSAKLRVAIKK